MLLAPLDKLRAPPDRARAIESYRALASRYDESCRRIVHLRARAVQRLAPKPGEIVFDIGCGTGATLLQLARKVGPDGRVIGVEPCAEMATLSRRRVRESELCARVQVLQAAAETFTPETFGDAVLLCFTHDVLQSAAAFDRLAVLVRPGARVVLVGLRTLPWSWGWPLNLHNLVRARRYLTTYANIDQPWRAWSTLGAHFDPVDSGWFGTAYIAVGHMPLAAPHPAGHHQRRENPP